MRSAETLNSAASSCSVAGSFSRSQRVSMMRRLRASRLASAFSRPRVSKRLFLLRLDQLRGLGRAVGQVRDGRVGLVLVARRLERDLLPGKAHLHLGDVFGLHA